MSRLLVVLIALAACGPKATDVRTAGAGSSGPTKAGAPAGSARPANATGAIPDVGCLTPTCAYHAGGNAYFTCFSGGAGSCFHFGGPCAPKDTCMYDSTDRTYKQCARVLEGTCQQFGAACAPQNACMFSPTDGLHHTCDEVAGGTCKRYGALCAP